MNFEQTLRLSGLHPRAIVADGRIRRCATETHPHKRNGWYVLHPDGHGVYGDWATGSSAPTGTWRDGSAEARPVDMERVRRQREQEREHRLRAMRGARAFWNSCRALTTLHPYLVDKGIGAFGSTGLKTPTKAFEWDMGRKAIRPGDLIVPAWLSSSLGDDRGPMTISLQSITEAGDKLFWPGAPMGGGCYILPRRGAALTVFVEGLATGLAVYQSVRHCRVVVCFDAGNLIKVAQSLKPTGSVVIAADNDWRTAQRRGFNPGLDHAKNAAELIGCGVAYPEGIDGSDWADALKEWGERAPKRIEREILAQACFVEAA